jgi:carboxylate-amine ligase
MSNLEWPARQVTTCALQIHVGMPSGDVAVSTARRLRSVLPIVLALSASSPFRDGDLTGLASTRTALFAAVPRSGPMPDFGDWQEYASYCETMADAGAMPSELSTWWDCRPQPKLGTLELRIADAVPDLDDALALCSLLWCLAVGADRLSDLQIPPLLSDENRWRALRFGWQARFLDAEGKPSRTLHELVDELLDTLGPIATDLGCVAPLQRCIALSRGEGRHQLQLPRDQVTGPDGDQELARSAASRLRVSW